MSNYLELLEEFKNGKGTFSVGDIRNENKQKKDYGTRISMLKKEKDTNCRLLVSKSIAIPFDPFSVQVTEDYHDDRKFRTEKTVSTTIGVLKAYYEQNAEAKQALLKKVRIEEWDTTNPEECNAKDLEVFEAFKVTNIFTIYYVHINNKVVTGRDKGADYRIEVPRDESGKIMDYIVSPNGEKITTPRYVKLAVQLGDFFSMINLERYKEWEQGEGANKTKNEQATKKMAFLNETPITQDRPKNLVLGIKLPMLPGRLDLDAAAIAKWEDKDFRKAMFITSNSSKLRTCLEEIPKLYSSKDNYADFYEIDMKVPNEDDDNKRGQDTNFTVRDNSIDTLPDDIKLKVVKGFKDVIDNTPNIDKIVLGSSYVQPLNDDIMNMLLKKVSEEYKFSNFTLTSRQINLFGDLLENIWGDEVSEVLMSAAMGELPDGSVSESELKSNKEEMNKAIQEMDLDIDMDNEVESITE